MVFCGIYPADGAKYPDLKDALEKLQLNDASLTFEPETSCGAGLRLPLRLPRSAAHGDHHRSGWSASSTSTSSPPRPASVYRLTLTDGTVVMIDNPSSYPDPSNIVIAGGALRRTSHLYAPNEYVGSLMDLCQKQARRPHRHEVYGPTCVWTCTTPCRWVRSSTTSSMPSRAGSRGYASYDYEFKELPRERPRQAGLPAQRRPRRRSRP